MNSTCSPSLPSPEPRSRSISAQFAAALRKPWLLCILLVVISVAVRSPSLRGERIWDDHYLTSENPLIKSPIFVLEVFRHYLFLDSFSTHYRPTQSLSYIADYFFWGDATYGFHLSNLLWHAASAMLLFLLLRELLPPLGARAKILLPFGIALLWAVHPVHSAAVDYMSGRADSLSFCFACAAWLLVINAARAQHSLLRAAGYFFAASCALLALCAREIACIWIALFLLHLFCFQSGASRRFKIAALVTCLTLIGAYAGLRHVPKDRIDPPPASTNWSAPVRGVLMLRALGDYGRLMLYPANLHMERNVIEPDNYRNSKWWRQSATAEYLSLGGLAVLAAFAAGAFTKGSARKLRIFGAAWFFLGYLPISNLVELNATVAEHWLYLPSVGFIIFLAGVALDLPPRYGRAAIAFACLAILGLSGRSVLRSSDWVTEQGFYERTLASGGSTVRVAVNLAQIYSRKGDLAKAETMFRKVLKLTPDYPFARNGLGQVLYQEGKLEESQALLTQSNAVSEESRKEYPRTWMAAFSLAHVKHDQHDTAGALQVLEQARQDYPRAWQIISFESELLRETAGPDAAINRIAEFAQANWWHYGAAMALGQLYANQGDVEHARAELRHASRLDVHDVAALHLIAFLEANQNHLAEACAAEQQAVDRQPDQPSQYKLLANILSRMGRTSEAQLAREKMLVLEAVARAEVAAN